MQVDPTSEEDKVQEDREWGWAGKQSPEIWQVRGQPCKVAKLFYHTKILRKESFKLNENL